MRDIILAVLVVLASLFGLGVLLAVAAGSLSLTAGFIGAAACILFVSVIFGGAK